MEGSHFGDADFDSTEEACRIVVDLSYLDETTLPREIANLIERARNWRRQHVSVVE